MKHLAKLLMGAALIALAAITNGCTHVNLWERSALADYTMRQDRNPLAVGFAEHTWFSREAASGGRGVGGGGCGCN